MTSLLLAVLVASLVGSLHCAGMCGGIVALCVGVGGDDTGGGMLRRSGRLLAAYNLGRLPTYAALGAASGLVGRAIDLGGGEVGMPRAAAVIAGALMIGFGVAVLLRAGGVRLGCASMPVWVRNLFARGTKLAMGLPPMRRAVIVGLLTGFLPCGWLYAFVVASASTGSALGGAAVMTAFWLGTVPVLVAVGFGIRFVAAPLRRFVPGLTAATLLIVGVVAVFGRLNVPSYRAEVDARLTSRVTEGEPAAAAAVVERTEGWVPPCCRDKDKVAGDAAPGSGGPAAAPTPPVEPEVEPRIEPRIAPVIEATAEPRPESAGEEAVSGLGGAAPPRGAGKDADGDGDG